MLTALSVKLQCIRSFNEHGLCFTAGQVIEVAQPLADYLLSNFPAAFTPSAPVASISSLPSGADRVTPVPISDPGGASDKAESPVRDMEQPPADKMVKQPKRRK